MKARVERPHFRKLQNQAAKADIIAAKIHELRAELGWTESTMIESVSRWPSELWARVALLCAKSPPSDDVRNAVLATLARSALVERLVEERTVPTLDHERDMRVEP